MDRGDIEQRLAPWGDALGPDREAYTNHVLRVLEFCDALHLHGGGSVETRPSDREEFVVAAVFHDLGIWSDGTFDYLAPSIERARADLAATGHKSIEPLVSEMIDEHHKVRAAGKASSPVEIFRRADTIDVTFGLRRFGLPRSEYRRIAAQYPDAGFHLRLVKLSGKRLVTKPLSPLPMFKW
ncbi:HD domain-containing protein [Antrihabitans sp. NCIMB 15449]|uniref:HD domain-containing protein n=2 Tax=Antrihabitans TaxID=2799491 RepID=A0A934U1K3_9NOCA|nr:HD domain-containing protein [Antrihabitans stalagmiti]MBJ8338177.1 hypothetical protein [Antrihabitans stalagmiti]